MFAPLDLDLIQDALTRPQGWIELGVIAGCFAVGWWIDQRVHLAGKSDSRAAKFGYGGVNRVIFPLTALLLLYLTHALLQRWHLHAFFPVAIPLAIALALIRLAVYVLRSLFGTSRWIPVSERAVSFTVWGALLLYYVGVLPQIANALDDAKLPIGKAQVSVLDLGRDALIVVLAIVISLWISGAIEQQLLRATNVDKNLRAVMAKFFRAILLLVGVLVALSVVGMDLTVLSVFGGALGVGIGLGLQKLASNYIAGFTILLDRSIRLGDMITVDNRSGIVTSVTSRYVVVRSLDGVEAIVPNELLVVTTVLNHSYTSRDVRIAIPVQISYDSDLDLAMRLLVDAARGEARVLQAPNPPAAFVLRFAESGIDLELGVWIHDPENGQINLKSALNAAIWRMFKANGVKIPFPQREVRLLGTAPDAQTAPPARP